MQTTTTTEAATLIVGVDQITQQKKIEVGQAMINGLCLRRQISKYKAAL